MKKLLLATAFLGSFLAVNAQKSITVETAGTLASLIPAEEVATLADLTVSGSINKVDLDTLAAMPALATLNLSAANIVEYSEDVTATFVKGETTYDSTYTVVYPANEFPEAVYAENKVLKSITFPNTIEVIGTEALNECIALESLDFSNCPDLKVIGYRAFGSLEALTSLSFKNCSKLDSIGEYAFTNSFNIANIDFTGCSALRVVCSRAFNNVREALTTLDLSDCVALTDISEAFRSLKKMETLVLPEGLKAIGYGAFYSCNAIETITIPASVDTIAPTAFYQPKALKNVICEGTSTVAAERAFTSSLSLSKVETSYPDYTLTVPAGSEEFYRACSEWAKFGTINSSAAIEAAEAEAGVMVYANGNEIVVKGAAGMPVTVIGLSGVQVLDTVADSDAYTVAIVQKGLFLVKIGANVYKVIL